MMATEQLIYSFEDIVVDTGEFRILRAGNAIKLERKAFEVLIYFLENPGRLISKEELLDAVWPDAFVTPNVLTRVIAQLRRELGDTSQRSRFIETVPTRGYRFTAVAERKESDTVAAEANAAEPTAAEVAAAASGNFWESRRGTVALGLCVIVVLGAIGYFVGVRLPHSSASTPPPGAEQTLAILPFQVVNPTDETGYMSIGIADSLITKLSNVRSLTVRPTNSVRRYSAADVDLARAGNELMVESVIAGTIYRVGDQIRVNVQMVRTSDGKPVWANSYDLQFSNILQVEDEISARITDSLKIKLSRDEKTKIERRPTASLEAYEACMRGIYQLSQLKPESLTAAIGYLNRAVELDPGYALAYARLANAYAISTSYNFPSGPELAESSARKAIELDPSLGEAHTSLAVIEFWGHHDSSKAQDSFVHALELDPGSRYTHEYYGWFLVAMGRFDEASRQLARAAELAPSEIGTVDEGLPLVFSRRYEQAEAFYRNALQDRDSFWFLHMGLATSCEGKGDLACSESEFRRAIELMPADPTMSVMLARTFAIAGRNDEARSLLTAAESDATGRLSYYYVALAYISLGEPDTAVSKLEQAEKSSDKWLGWLKADPRLDPLRSLHRFNELLVRSKLN